MTTQLATPKQIDFLRKLTDERTGFGPVALTDTLSGKRAASRSEASEWISQLLKAPRRIVAPVSPASGVADALKDVENSKYAVPTAGLVLPGVDIPGDLLFLEVREYMGRKYLRRLVGAPGSFSRLRFSAAHTIALAAVIKGKHVEYARLFGEHYTCCGRCAAPLTDQKSRETYLGPTCRKVFGL